MFSSILTCLLISLLCARIYASLVTGATVAGIDMMLVVKGALPIKIHLRQLRLCLIHSPRNT